MRYIGRFAPSPSGPLHLGSLYTALASYLHAKSHNGLWQLRIEDIDPPREEPGASSHIIKCLQAHGLHADGEITFQSHNHDRYQKHLNDLLSKDLSYACFCNRKRLIEFQGFYDRHCLKQNPTTPTVNNKPFAYRLLVNEALPSFDDQLQGHQIAPSSPELYHDFIIKRKDQLWAYQLAMVADDIAEGSNHIVRGVDLIENTHKQLYLFKLLDNSQPSFIHLPVLSNQPGFKLSKQNKAAAVQNSSSIDNLLLCLKLLGQTPPPKELRNSPESILTFATEHFTVENIPNSKEILI